MNQINTSQVKKIAQNLDEPVRIMINSLPDEIDSKALVEKFDLILLLLSKKKEGSSRLAQIPQRHPPKMIRISCLIVFRLPVLIPC